MLSCQIVIVHVPILTRVHSGAWISPFRLTAGAFTNGSCDVGWRTFEAGRRWIDAVVPVDAAFVGAVRAVAFAAVTAIVTACRVVRN